MSIELIQTPIIPASTDVVLGYRPAAGNTPLAPLNTTISALRTTVLNGALDVPSGLAGLDANLMPNVLGRNYNPDSSNWLKSGDGLALSGDSTTSQAVTLFDELKVLVTEGNLLDGVVILGGTSAPPYGFGSNGMTLETMLTLADSNSASLTSIVASNPKVIIYSWGVNDVRQGATSQNQLTVRLTTLVNRTRAAAPNAKIVLRIPLALGIDADGYVVPPSNAQLYTDILRNSYLSLRGVWPDVYVLDSQKLLSGTLSRSLANNPLMADALHPNNDGQSSIAILIGNKFTVNKRIFNSEVARITRQSHYATDYLYYFQSVEDSNYYDVVASGNLIGSDSNFWRIDFPSTRIAEIQVGDIFVTGNTTPFVITDYGGANGPNIDWFMSHPGFGNSTLFSIYRHKFGHSAAIEAILKSRIVNPYVWLGKVGYAGNGQVELISRVGEINSLLRTATVGADKIVFENGDVVALTDYYASNNNGNMLVNRSGVDFSGHAGQNFLVYGNHDYENGTRFRRMDDQLKWLQVN